MENIIVTGASGFLGAAACRRLSVRRLVHGLWLTTPVTHKPKGLGVTSSTLLDLRDDEALRQTLDRLAPQVVVHLAALSKPEACERDPELSREVNVEATTDLARACAERSIRLVFASTDNVFSGRDAPYAETDAPDPINVYGAHKAEAEAAVLAASADNLVCRFSTLYGRAPHNRPGFLQQLAATAHASEPWPLFSDEYRSFLCVSDAAEGLALALGAKAKGILHLAGPERMSRLEFGYLAEGLGMAVKIGPGLRADYPGQAPRPRDLTLCAEHARQLGFEPLPVGRQLTGLLNRLVY